MSYGLKDSTWIDPDQEDHHPRTCGECEEFRMCCGCGGGWCMELLEPVNEADEACDEEPVFAPRMEGCAI